MQNSVNKIGGKIMKKIGIVTLFGNYNYGNRLQNYAVQEIAKKYGYKVDTLVFVVHPLKEIARKCQRFIYRLHGRPEIKRYDSFSQFNRRKISMKKIKLKKGKIPKNIKHQYLAFWVGSDQVWNPEIRQDQRKIFFLQFADINQRICISPSIGVSHIDDSFKKIFYEGLNGFNYLCCREEAGAKEIERISGKKCLCLIDPTLVITSAEWRRFSGGKELLKEKYVFCFFLGEIDQKLRNKIWEFARDNNCKIILSSDDNSGFYDVNPQEFVSLLDHAEMIFTDSFHVAAFSINLNKAFYVFDRFDKNSQANHVNSRIVSLVSLFRVNDRYKTTMDFEFETMCDFSEANEILEIERKKFNNYLNRCLESTETMRNNDGK